MGLTTKEKNELVEVEVLRPFRIVDKKTGEVEKIRPNEGENAKPKIIELPYQFAREMEAANKVSFRVRKEVNVEEKKAKQNDK